MCSNAVYSSFVSVLQWLNLTGENMNNEVEQIALQNDMSIEFVTWFFNEKKAGCGNVWFMMMAAMWEGWQGRSIEMDKLAAENVALKAAIPDELFIDVMDENIDDISLAEDIGFNACVRRIARAIQETPATDRIVAGIKADGVEEFAEKLRIPGDYPFMDAVADGVAGAADSYSKQLREGAK